ncbi:MAG: ParB/RepB/Spo0J family partition protein [Pseudomonadota bacterium]
MNDKSTMMSGISDFLEQEETDRLVELLLTDVDPDPDQDRHSWDSEETKAHVASMTESIKANGVRRPIEVYEHVPGRYMIIAGEVRYRGSIAAEKETIPALLRLNTDEKQRSMDMLTENFSRLGLAPMELARALKRRIDGGITREEIMASTGKDKAWLSRMLGLLELPLDVQEFAETGTVRDPARLHSLAKIDEDNRPAILENLASGDATVGEVLAAQKDAKNAGDKKPKNKTKKNTPLPPDLAMTREEAQALITFFHPDREPCESDDALDTGFKAVVVELLKVVESGQRYEPANDAATKTEN